MEQIYTYNFVTLEQLLAEGAIFVLQAFNHWQRHRQHSPFKTMLIHTLYRDGYVYFTAAISARLMAVLVVRIHSTISLSLQRVTRMMCNWLVPSGLLVRPHSGLSPIKWTFHCKSFPPSCKSHRLTPWFPYRTVSVRHYREKLSTKFSFVPFLPPLFLSISSYSALVSRFFLRLRAAAEEPNETVAHHSGGLSTDQPTGYSIPHVGKWVNSQTEHDFERGSESLTMPLEDLRKLRTSRRFAKWSYDPIVYRPFTFYTIPPSLPF